MGESLEDKTNTVPEQKHGDRYLMNKEILVGELCAVVGAFGAALGSSYFVDSKLGSSAIGTVGSSIGYHVGYLTCAYIDRRKDYETIWGFFGYLIKFGGTVGLPAGFFYHTTHVGTTYGLQELGMPKQWAAAIAHFPAMGVGLCAANVFYTVTNVVKNVFRKLARGRTVQNSAVKNDNYLNNNNPQNTA